MTALETRQQIQKLLCVEPDGNIGPKTLAALQSLVVAPEDSPWPPTDDIHHVKATSFADPADVAAFKRCKAMGGSDQHCFSQGDNGIGKWGDDCTKGSGPKCALPPEDWIARYGVNARHAKVLVTVGEKSVVCQMDDTMPHRANITNGAGIDLNPDACEALGLTPPVMTDATWKWA